MTQLRPRAAYKIVNRRKRYATMLADAVGRVLYLPKTIASRRSEIDPELVRRILIIRTAYIGDVMMTVPMLHPLRQRFPSAHISFLTSGGAVPLLRNNPDLDEIIVYDPFWFHKGAVKSDYLHFLKTIRQRQFDLVIEARADIREILMLVRPLRARFKVSYGVGGGAYMLTHVVPYPGVKHKVEYHLDICRYLGCPVEGVVWDVHLSADEREGVGRILAENGIQGPFVAVHPGSRLALKRWLKQRYAALFDRIVEDFEVSVVVLGAASETALVDEIIARMSNVPVNLSGKLSLRSMAGVLARARAFVCNDSAPMHVAAAVGTPTVALFGPSKSLETAPFGAGHRVVECAMPCRDTCDEGVCLHEDRHACMRGITVDQVLLAIRDVLRNS